MGFDEKERGSSPMEIEDGDQITKKKTKFEQMKESLFDYHPLHLAKKGRDYAKESFLFYKSNKLKLKAEILSGLTVAVMQVPESVAFSFTAGVDPLVGLHSTFFLGLITSLIGGRPGMISGAAGAMAVLVTPITSDDGPLKDLSYEQRLEALFMTLVFVGLFQFILGFLRMGTLVRLIGKAPMVGFLNGLAIIIFMAQLQAFQYCPKDDELCTSRTDDRKVWYQIDDPILWIMFGYIICTMIIVHYLPKVKYVGKILPSSLVALIVVSVFEHGINRPFIDQPTRTVRDQAPISGSLPKFHIPNVDWDGDVANVIFTSALSLTAVGLIESVMTLQAVNKIVGAENNNFKNNQECVAQGVANFICGFFGAMGGDAMIGQSTLNVLGGARGRLSAFCASIGIIIIILAASKAIELIPIAGLTGILFMVVLHTFCWNSLKILLKRKIPGQEAIVIVMVTVLAVTTNLAIAVLAGVAFEALIFSFRNLDLFHRKDLGYVFSGDGTIHMEETFYSEEAVDLELENSKDNSKEERRD